MNKAQARAATAKLLAVNPHRAVMEAFMAGAQVTLQGEHIPAPSWVAGGPYVAFKDGKEVARSTPPPKQDEVPGNAKPCAPPFEEETPETKAFKAELERMEKLRKGVSTWDRFKDLGTDIVDACQAQLPAVHGWTWFAPDTVTDPRHFHRAMPERHYDVVRRDGYLFRNIPESLLKWGPARPGSEAAEIVRYRLCGQAEGFATPPGSFQAPAQRIYSKSFP